ncbi:MAG: ATP-binding protein [Actinobacteria bacterium]|nr:ATP-binding protein [Actinomycetota bacterium]
MHECLSLATQRSSHRRLVDAVGPTPRTLKLSTVSFVIAEPRAAALIESLRAFGYAFPTAVADLVDNSISAGASRVAILAQWAGGNSYVTIADDGRGMSEERVGAENTVISVLGRRVVYVFHARARIPDSAHSGKV